MICNPDIGTGLMSALKLFPHLPQGAMPWRSLTRFQNNMSLSKVVEYSVVSDSRESEGVLYDQVSLRKGDDSRSACRKILGMKGRLGLVPYNCARVGLYISCRRNGSVVQRNRGPHVRSGVFKCARGEACRCQIGWRYFREEGKTKAFDDRRQPASGLLG